MILVLRCQLRNLIRALLLTSVVSSYQCFSIDFGVKTGYYYYENENLNEAYIYLSSDYVYKKGSVKFTSELNAYYSFDNTENSYFDIQELSLSKKTDHLFFKVGAFVETWGVSDSSKILDIFTTNNLSNDLFNSEPVAQYTFKLDWANESFNTAYYYNPLLVTDRFNPIIDTVLDHDNTVNDDSHIIRISSNNLNNLDINFTYLNGLDRNFIVGFDSSTQSLESRYLRNQLWGLSLVYETAFITKLEFLHDAQHSNNSALLGFEFNDNWLFKDYNSTFSLEYSYKDKLTGSISDFFDNDIFIGNSVLFDNLSELTTGISYDVETGDKIFSLEYQKELNDYFRLSINLKKVQQKNANPLFDFEGFSHLTVSINYDF